MAFYSDELIEEVRSANNIVDVVGSYVSLKKKGSTYVGLCPFHNEKTGSFSVSDRKQIYHCFGCGAGGNVFTFVMNYENMSFPEAMEFLADRVGIKLPKRSITDEERQKADKRTRILELNKTAATYFYQLLRNDAGKRGMDYFKKRGLSDDIMRAFGLGYSDVHSNDLYQYLKSKGADDAILKESGLVTIDERKGGYDKFWNRVMFPIMDVHNHVIGFGGRVMGDGEPKYLNSPETICFDKSRNLYGLNIARTSRRDYLLLCEGYMDVISLHQAGFDNAVASLGTALTSGHANLLKRYTKDVYITYDSDGAGQKAALRAIPILRDAGLNVKVIDMKPYKDPDEFMKDEKGLFGGESVIEYERRISNAENGFFFEIGVLESKYDLKDPGKKTEFYNEIAKCLSVFTDDMERENYTEAIANRYGIDFSMLKRKVGEILLLNDGKKVNSELKSGTGVKIKKEDGRVVTQKIFLTMLIDHPEIFPSIKELIEPGDFTDELIFKVAMIVFEGLEHGDLNPAEIVSRFETEEEQREVASLFQSEIGNLSSVEEFKAAVKETLLKVKRIASEHRKEGANDDIRDAMERLKKDREIENRIKNLNLTINEDGGN